MLARKAVGAASGRECLINHSDTLDPQISLFLAAAPMCSAARNASAMMVIVG